MTGNNNVVALLNAGGNGENAQILSIFNADAEAQTVTLPEGEWNVYVNKEAAGTEILTTVSGEVKVEGTSAMIMVLAEKDEEPTTPSEDPTEEPTEAPTVAPSEKPTEAPTEKPTTAPGQSGEATDTGDNSSMMMWIVLCTICAAGAAVLFINRKKFMNI